MVEVMRGQYRVLCTDQGTTVLATSRLFRSLDAAKAYAETICASRTVEICEVRFVYLARP